MPASRFVSIDGSVYAALQLRAAELDVSITSLVDSLLTDITGEEPGLRPAQRTMPNRRVRSAVEVSAKVYDRVDAVRGRMSRQDCFTRALTKMLDRADEKRRRMAPLELAVALVAEGETCRRAAMIYDLEAEEVVRAWNRRSPNKRRQLVG